MILITENNSVEIEKIRSRFLVINITDDPLDLKDFAKKCVIYCIENKKSHKIYIGKTTSLLNRSGHYIRDYRNKHLNGLKINKAIIEEGIENFRMFPIKICKDRYEMALDERMFIELYRSYDPKRGYNEYIPSGNESFHTNMRGHKHSTQTKILKSKFIVCINPDLKRLYVASGMKIFGDFASSSKDQVKNCARRGIRHHGYYIIYCNTHDRDFMYNKIVSKLDVYNNWRESSRPKYDNANYDTYLYFVRMVNTMIDNASASNFTSCGYKCAFITYSEKPSSTAYTIKPIDDFFSMLEISHTEE